MDPALAPQWLTDTLAQLNAQLAALAEQQANQISRISEQIETNSRQVSQLASQQASYAGTTPQTVPQAATPTDTPVTEAFVRKPKPSLSDPERYDNTDKTLYPQFAGLLRAKVKYDGLSIGNEQEKTWYMFGRLKGDAAKRIFPWINAADQDGTLCTDDLFRHMDAAFSDPRAKEKALALLNCTKQGALPLNDFLGKFDQLLLEAGGWDWDDNIKKGYLKDAISTKLLSSLIGTEEKASYEEYCNQLRRVWDQVEEVKERTSKYPHQWRKRARDESVQPPAEHDPMDWEAVIAAAVKVAAGRTEQKGDRWASDDEIDRRRQEGLCLRCGGKGHFVRNCRTKKPPSTGSKKTRVAAAKTQKAKRALPQEDNDDGDGELSSASDESSGKE
jgi:hypothetical protein